MGMYANFYTIVGYDFSAYKDVLIDEKWAYDPKNEKYTCSQGTGFIQLFDDGHVFFGYILADGDEYGMITSSMDVKELKEIKQKVDLKLYASGLNFCNLPDDALEFKIISFVEYR